MSESGENSSSANDVLTEAVASVLKERGLDPVIAPTLEERAGAMADHIQYVIDDFHLNPYEKYLLVRILVRKEEFLQHEVFRSCGALLLLRFRCDKTAPVDLHRVGRVLNFVCDLLHNVL